MSEAMSVIEMRTFCCFLFIFGMACLQRCHRFVELILMDFVTNGQSLQHHIGRGPMLKVNIPKVLNALFQIQ